MRTDCLKWLAAGAMWLALGGAAQTQEAAEPGRAVIANVTVIPMDRNGRLPNRDVVVEGGRIVAILPAGRTKPRAGERRIDGRGKLLIPGLWDMHAHVTVPDSAGAPAGDPDATVRQLLPRYLAHGIVGVRDLGSGLEPLAAVRTAMGEAATPLPALAASGPLLDGPKQFWTKAVALPAANAGETRADATRIADSKVDLLKAYDVLSAEQLAAVVEVARARSLPVTGHVPLAMSAETATAAGLTGIEHANLQLVEYCVPGAERPRSKVLSAWIKDGYAGKYRENARYLGMRDPALCRALFARMAARGVSLTPTLVHEIKGPRWTTPDDVAAVSTAARAGCQSELANIGKAPAALRDDVDRQIMDIVREMHRAGVTILAGSDAPNACISHGPSLHRELELLVEAGLTPQEALRAATLNAAKTRGRTDEGAIGPGKAADLLLLDADPLRDISNTRRIAGVMRGGAWLDGEKLAAMREATATSAVVYTGARVWTGEGWEVRDVAVDGDRIVDAATVPAGARRIDLAGKFLSPAYGNAHAHVTNGTAEASRSYTDVGVFYVWNPTTVVIGPEQRAFFARPDAYDVKVSQGGITEPGGHPEKLYVEYLAKPVYGGKPRDWFVGNAFHYGATPAQIDAALDMLKGQGAQFVKAYLLYSERYEALKNDPKAYGAKGLNPVNLPYLVAQAHRRGLPVAVHVQTAHDLRMAAWAGADVAAHLPGYSGGTRSQLDEARLSDADARLVAQSGMSLVPTFALIRGHAYGTGAGGLKPEARDAAALQADNLKRLRAAGAPLLIGTDGRGEIFTEVEHLVEIGALTHAEAAGVALNTAARMSPERRVGCLAVGCEADFLVLGADPVQDVRNLRRIERRVMQGRDLPAPKLNP